MDERRSSEADTGRGRASPATRLAWIPALAILVALLLMLMLLRAWNGSPAPDEISPGPDEAVVPAAPAVDAGVLRGSRDAETRPVRLTLTVLEGEARTPVADESVFVAVFQRAQPANIQRWSEYTDAEGRVDLVLREGDLGSRGLTVDVVTQRHPPQDASRVAAHAEGEGLFTATVVLHPGAVARVLVVPPAGVPLDSVRLWHRRGPWEDLSLTLTPEGKCQLKGFDEGAEIHVVAAALHEGIRYAAHGRGVAGGAVITPTWTEVRPGDRALLGVGLHDEAGRKVMALLTLTDDSVQAFSSSEVGRGIGLRRTLLDFVYQPGLTLGLLARPMVPKGLARVARASIPMSQTSVDLVFPPGRTLRGRVVRRDGGPLAGLVVRVPSMSPAPNWTYTDESGTFTIRDGSAHEVHRIVVRETKGGPILAEVEVGMDDDDIEVVVEATEEVALRIEDTRGSPVVGAHVELSLPPPGVTLDPELPPYGDVSFRVISDGTTDAEGRVVLAGVDVARLHRLTVRAPDERRELLSLEIQGWTPRDEVLALERGFFVTGSVRDVDQRAIAGRTVLATCPALPEGGAAVHRRLDGGIRRVSRQVRTNEVGAFRLGPLPRGSWMLSVYGAEDSATGVTVDRDVDSVVLTLPAAEAAPVVDLCIRVPDFAEEDRGTMVFLGSNHARLDDEGCVVFRGAQVGKAYALWIAGLSGGRYVWEKEFHVDGEDMTIRPRRGGTIRGSVRVPEGAQLDSLALWPMGIIRVWIEEDPQAGSFDCSTDYVAGTFEVVGVPPGTWTVLVWGDCGEVTYEGEIEAGPGDEVVVDLTSE